MEKKGEVQRVKGVQRDVSKLFCVLVLGGISVATQAGCSGSASEKKCTQTDAGQVCPDAGSGGGVHGW